MNWTHLPLGNGIALGALLLLSGCWEQPPARAVDELLPPVSARGPTVDRVSALGRLEPEDGLIRVAGPSGVNAVIGMLFVDDGDMVEEGQLIATLDTVEERAARVDRLEAELGRTRRQQGRFTTLHSEDAASDSLRDEWETQVRISKSELREAKAAFERAHVRAPISGRVITVHARQGERIGVEGVVELGRTDHMFAIAEVYETDIGWVKVGQRATVTSPALSAPLTGTVDWVNLRVAKQDTLGTDPAARKDARVVEVEIRLDDSEVAAPYTNLQVEVEIEH
jgi:HlyD family secretion protein